MITQKFQFIWQSYQTNNCLGNTISDKNKMSTIFVVEQQGASVEPSTPFLAGLNSTFNNINCGAGYMVYSDDVPYDLIDAKHADYESDSGRIATNFPMEFVINNLSGNYDDANGTYKITTKFYKNKPTYKNDKNWFISWNINNWKLCNDDELPTLDCYVSNNVTGPYVDLNAPTPTPSEEMEIPDVPIPVTENPTNDRTPKMTWQPVKFAEYYEVIYTLDGINDDRVFQTTKTSYTYPESIPLNAKELRGYVRAVNSLGASNYSVSATARFDFNAPLAPRVFTDYTNGISKTSKPTIEIRDQDSGNDKKFIDIAVDGVLIDTIDFTGSRIFYIFKQDLDDGERTIYVRYIDHVGNKSQYATKNITIDTTPPEVPVITGPESPTSDNTPTFTWNSLGSTHKEVKLNGTSLGVTTNTGSYTPTLTDGEYTIQIRQRDGVGNWSDWSEIITIVIDITGPVAVVWDDMPTRTNNTKPTWSWKSNSDAVLYELRWYASTGSSSVLIGTQESNSYTPTSDLNQPYDRRPLYVRGKDSLGNWGPWSGYTITVDTDITKPSSLRLNRTETELVHNTGWYATFNKLPMFEWFNNDGNFRNSDFKINDEIVANEILGTSYQTTKELTAGYHVASLRSRDDVGNVSDWVNYGIYIYDKLEFRWHEIDGETRLQVRKNIKPLHNDFISRNTNLNWSTVYAYPKYSGSTEYRQFIKLDHSVYPAVAQWYESRYEADAENLGNDEVQLTYAPLYMNITGANYWHLNVSSTPINSQNKQAVLRNGSSAIGKYLVVYVGDNDDPDNLSLGDTYNANNDLFSIILRDVV